LYFDKGDMTFSEQSVALFARMNADEIWEYGGKTLPSGFC